MSGYAQFAERYRAAGWAPLPLPHGAKAPVPQGWTGYDGAWPSAADVADWSATAPEANIALRMPPTVVGIDYDAYKADGVATMTELAARLGPLPPTWRSSSRSDAGSGIYFYRLPDDLPHLGDVGQGIETIRFGHRYAVVAPSTHPSGAAYRWYAPDGSARAPRVDELPDLPISWVTHLVERGAPKVKEAGVAPAAAYEGLDDAEKRRIDSFVKTSVEGIVADLRESAAWPVGQTDRLGRGWEKLQADKAIRLAQLALADWNTMTMQQAHDVFVAAAPVGAGWSSRDVEAKWAAQSRRAEPAPYPPNRERVDLLAGAPDIALPQAPQQTVAHPSSRELIHGDLEALDVSNAARVVEWLRETLGTGPLSGIFARGADVVFTPRMGADGYVAPRVGEPVGAASISILDHYALAARIQSRFACFKTSEIKNPDGTTSRVTSPALFPPSSALHAVKAPDDMPHLAPLRGVVHAPTFRPDLTLLDQPGYDVGTGVLFLPTGGQPTAAVPVRPNAGDVELARRWIDYMLQDFAFVTADDRASYIGLMLTPLLREVLPPPYKLGVIEAHQPGSGKTFLARALTTIHSGLMHSELPDEEPEVVKTVTSILDTSTGAVVVFDNVTGVVRSSVLAGLLTSPTFQGRRLGTGKLVDTVNDRLWVITANNAALGGDLPRRSMRVHLDPGLPNPEKRTKFAIADFEGWVREHRGDLLWSLLTLVRNWVALGSPMPDEIRADSYGRWSAVIGSILACAGVPGTFDDPDAVQDVDPEVEEWTALFERVHELYGDQPWTTKQLLHDVAPMGIETIPGQMAPPIPFDMLPSSLIANKGVVAPQTLGKALGRFLMNRQGRWFGSYSVRQAGQATSGEGRMGRLWRVSKYGS